MQQGQHKNQYHCNSVDGSNRMAFAAAVATSTSPAAALALVSTFVGVAVANDATDVTPERGTELDIGENDFEIAMDSWNQSNGYGNHSNLLKNHGEYNNLSYNVRVNPFWLEFQPPSTEAFHIMAIIYIMIMIIGCFGNAFVIFMFIRFKSLRTQANVLVINLAISDFFMVAKCPIAVYNSFKEGPALGDWGCRIYGFLGGLTGTTSIITLTAIAIDRYKVVVHPLDSIRYSSKNRIRCTLTFIWFYSFVFSVIPALDIGLSVYTPEGFLTTCGFDYLDRSLPARIFMFVFFVGAWCVPFGIIIYCYMYILKVVCSGSIRSSKDKFKTEIKLCVIVFVIIWLWFLAWTPYSIVALLGISGNENKLTPLTSMIPAIFCKSSACIDPYIYAATHPRFRMELRRLVYGGLPVRRSSTMRSSAISRSTTSKRLRKDCISDVQTRNGMTASQRKVNMSIIEEKDESDIYLEQQDSDIEQSRF